MERSSRSTGQASPAGWLRRGGMFIIGSLDALWGLGGILNDDIVVVGGQGASWPTSRRGAGCI